MSQQLVEHLIGRLITDEDFRREFEADPHGVLRALVERGTALTPAEVAALVATSRVVWETAAQAIDPRLQKVSLKRGRQPRAEADDDGVE